jgi:HEPN domain-containing protein
MSEREHALGLLRMAEKDLAALRGMMDEATFADEVFGFHAQQAAEKALKAWLSALGREYPLTHNLATLLNALSQAGGDVTLHWALVEYNPFGVQFRYEELDTEDEPVDRQAAVDAVEKLVAEAGSAVRSARGPESGPGTGR